MRAMPQGARGVLLALTLALAPPAAAQAQDFPSRPVRFVVPYAAGGSGDLLARLLGGKLASLWGQQVVIDNRAGAGGLLGTDFAAHSEPDGYTLYLATDGPLTVAASLYKRVPYDWKRDFAPVAMMAMGYQVLIINPALPARNLQEFIALARQKPGELNYASIGIGSAPHLGAELFKAAPRSISLTCPIAAPRRRRSPRCLRVRWRCSWSGPRPPSRTSRAGRCAALL
jgi:tripartite-type tricarboxylate transporter receptor subunit TctC